MRRAAVVRLATFTILYDLPLYDLPLYDLPLYELPLYEFTLNHLFIIFDHIFNFIFLVSLVVSYILDLLKRLDKTSSDKKWETVFRTQFDFFLTNIFY
jgi:hypothetical protein